MSNDDVSRRKSFFLRSSFLNPQVKELLKLVYNSQSYS